MERNNNAVRMLASLITRETSDEGAATLLDAIHYLNAGCYDSVRTIERAARQARREGK